MAISLQQTRQHALSAYPVLEKEYSGTPWKVKMVLVAFCKQCKKNNKRDGVEP